MMRKILILSLASLSALAIAQTATKEAIILNQELQYLEDSINNVQSMALGVSNSNNSLNRAINEESLEKTYFNDYQEDEVSTRSAVPKRRTTN